MMILLMISHKQLIIHVDLKFSFLQIRVLCFNFYINMPIRIETNVIDIYKFVNTSLIPYRILYIISKQKVMLSPAMKSVGLIITLFILHIKNLAIHRVQMHACAIKK